MAGYRRTVAQPVGDADDFMIYFYLSALCTYGVYSTYASIKLLGIETKVILNNPIYKVKTSLAMARTEVKCHCCFLKTSSSSNKDLTATQQQEPENEPAS